MLRLAPIDHMLRLDSNTSSYCDFKQYSLHDIYEKSVAMHKTDVVEEKLSAYVDSSKHLYLHVLSTFKLITRCQITVGLYNVYKNEFIKYLFNITN